MDIPSPREDHVHEPSSKIEQVLHEEYDIIEDSEVDTSPRDQEQNISDTSNGSSTKSKVTVSKPTDKSMTNSSERTFNKRLSSTDVPPNPPSVMLPHVDCPEKIIICLDLSQEMMATSFKSRAGDKYSGFELARRAIKMFVMHKSQMNPDHQFAFFVFEEEATMVQSFTKRPQEIVNTLQDSEIEPHETGPFNLSNLFETIKASVDVPSVKGDPRVIPPPYIVRVLLLYGRSHSVPVSPCQKAQRELESSPYFFTDVLYIHEPPSEENQCENIFKMLCDLDHNGLSYIFEQSKYTQILNSGAKLLAHPLQRPRQFDAVYKIGSGVPAQTFPQTSSSGLVEEKVY